MKTLMHAPHGLDCRLGVWPCSAARLGLGGAPLGHRLGTPPRKVATPRERGLVRRRVRQRVTWCLERVAPVFAVCVRHVATWQKMLREWTRLWRPCDVFNHAIVVEAV